jgi:hypothetical protein
VGLWLPRPIPRVNVTVESGGSTNGARRVCGVLPGGSIVDIAAMPRKFSIPGEVVNATNATAGQFICNRGDTTRKIQQFEVGLDGLTMILASSSLAAQCPRKISGLTIAQLHFMYSNNFSEIQQGLDTPEKVKVVIPNSDGNIASRNWRELDVTCPATNVRIAGLDPESIISQFFQDVVFRLRSQGENFEDR